MPRDGTQYTIVADEPSLNDELRELDWANGHQPPVQEAAALVYEMLTNPEAGDEPGLYELLAEVPSAFRNEVLAAVLRESMPAQERGATDAAPEPTEHRSQVDAAEQYRHTEQTSDDAAAQHPDLERTQHVLKYVEEICGEDAAYDLEKVMHDSRNLEIRGLYGTTENYGQDAHELYIQCVADIPATLDAKQAMSHTPWDDAQLQEAVQHEVNRMAYRLNLEIQDRLLTQIDSGAMHAAFARIDRLLTQIDSGAMHAAWARIDGMDQEIVTRLQFRQRHMRNFTATNRREDEPTYERLREMALRCMLELGTREAIQADNESAVRALAEPIPYADQLEKRTMQALEYMKDHDIEAINQALDTAYQWSDEEIKDGALDYHVEYADLGYVETNQAREEWLTSRNDGAAREIQTGDCATRALNEATGGTSYGDIWQLMTDATKTYYPHKDADDGAYPDLKREVYLQHGMQPMLETYYDMDHVMNKHLTMHEVPTLIGHLFPDPKQPLTYIAGSDNHAVAAVDGVVHDTWDSRNPDEWKRLGSDNGTLTELWIKCDEQSVLDAAREIIDRYTEVRRYDDVLTYRKQRRQSY